MQIVDLISALKSIGCDKKDIDDALQNAWLQEYHRWAEEISPALRAALAGRHKVQRQTPFVEAWLGYALYYYQKVLSLEEVLESADAINHAIPRADEVAWAFLRLGNRGWLAVQGDLYGLTAEGRRAIGDIVTEGNVRQLKEWISSHPPHGEE